MKPLSGVAVRRTRKAMSASRDRRRLKMNAVGFQRITAAVAATAIAAAVATFAAGPVQAQTHSHDHDAATRAKLSLDHGRKWATDEALRGGMGRIRSIVEPQLAAAHAGKLSAAQYAALAGQVEAEVGGIVANCKLEPKADAVLHVVIGEIGAGTDAMAGKTAKQRPQQGLVQVARAVNDYAGYFDHPGLEPIRNVH
jgi:hypothetical protein